MILGRKPVLEGGLGNHSLEKENRGPENVVAGLADTMLSKVRPHCHLSQSEKS